MTPAPQYFFPSGNYSATDGNPCGVCSDATAPVKADAAAGGQYCCTSNLQCLPQDFADCLVSFGCTYNCLDVAIADYDACEMGQCEVTTTTVLHPFQTGNATSS